MGISEDAALARDCASGLHPVRLPSVAINDMTARAAGSAPAIVKKAFADARGPWSVAAYPR